MLITDLICTCFYVYLAVKKAVLQGDIDQAIRILGIHFPAVLQHQGSGSHILFQLKCQKFVEMVGEYDNKDDQRRRSRLGTHQRHYSEVDSMISLSSDDDHTSTLSSSQSSTHDYFDHNPRHHTDISTSPNNDMEHDRHHHQPFHPLAPPKIKDDGKPTKWASTTFSSSASSNSSSGDCHLPLQWNPTSSRSRSTSAHAYHGYSPPITTDSPAPGRRMSWAAIVATPASPTTATTTNHHHDTMDLIDSGGLQPSSSSSRRRSLRRNSSSSNGYSSCGSLSGFLAGDGVLTEQDESQSSDDMGTDDGMTTASLQSMMQSIMTFGQELQDLYGKDPSPTVKDKLKVSW